MFEAGAPVGVRVHVVKFIFAFEVLVGVFVGQPVIGRIGALVTISTQALSKATGSKEAAIPRSGITAASLVCQQSHSGETFMIKLTWK